MSLLAGYGGIGTSDTTQTPPIESTTANPRTTQHDGHSHGAHEHSTGHHHEREAAVQGQATHHHPPVHHHAPEEAHAHTHSHVSHREIAEEEARAERLQGADRAIGAQRSPDNARQLVVNLGDQSNEVTISQNHDGHLVFSDARDGERSVVDPSGLDSILVRGQGGNDSIRIDESVSAQNAERLRISGGEGDDFLVGSQHADNLIGGSGNDVIVASGGEDQVSGGSGNDSIFGGDGHDRLFGGDGDDSIHGGDQRDELRGGRGNDTLRGDSDRDLLFGDAGDDRLLGGGARDRLYGGEGDDTLRGGDGDDLIAGQQGNDTLRGGAGHNVLLGGAGNDDIASAPDGHDFIEDGAGADTVLSQAQDTQNDHVRMFIDERQNTVLALDDGDNDATISETEDGRVRVEVDGQEIMLNDRAALNLVIRGGGGNDTIRLDESLQRNIHVEGGAGNDTLIGNDHDNTLLGNDGDDTIRGGGGGDYLDGGRGNDVIHGGAGDDVIHGLDGNDSLHGDAGEDYIDGGRGRDTIRGGADNDTLMGGRGNDRILGGAGDDVLAGGAGTDTLNAGQGADRLYTQRDDHVAADADGNTITEVQLQSPHTDGARLGHCVHIAPDDSEFAARVESDLDAYRSIPIGRRMLRELDASGHDVFIVPSQTTSDGNSARARSYALGSLREDGTPNEGTDAQISYNHTRNHLGVDDRWAQTPPMAILFHELSHAHNYTHGTLQRGETTYDGPEGPETDPNRELAAAGLPYDHDGDASTPLVLSQQPSENDIRRELGLPQRDHY